jgi:L-fuculose-phosphate aldolase
MPSPQDHRELLCEIGRRVWQRGFVANNDGNFSVRLGEDRILCTPTGMSKGFMQPEDMVEITLQGEQVAGSRRMTSEVRLHLFLYQNRPDINAVVHAHPAHATAFAISGQALPKCVLPEIEVFLGEIPMTNYETPGTWKFAETLQPYVAKHVAWLLKSHGVVTAGDDLEQAYYRMESVEHYCRILILSAQLGGWNSLPSEAVNDLRNIRTQMGLPDLAPGADSVEWCQSDSGVPPTSAASSRQILSPKFDPARDAIRRAVKATLRDLLK